MSVIKSSKLLGGGGGAGSLKEVSLVADAHVTAGQDLYMNKQGKIAPYSQFYPAALVDWPGMSTHGPNHVLRLPFTNDRSVILIGQGSSTSSTFSFCYKIVNDLTGDLIFDGWTSLKNSTNNIPTIINSNTKLDTIRVSDTKYLCIVRDSQGYISVFPVEYDGGSSASSITVGNNIYNNIDQRTSGVDAMVTANGETTVLTMGNNIIARINNSTNWTTVNSLASHRQHSAGGDSDTYEIKQGKIVEASDGRYIILHTRKTDASGVSVFDPADSSSTTKHAFPSNSNSVGIELKQYQPNKYVAITINEQGTSNKATWFEYVPETKTFTNFKETYANLTGRATRGRPYTTAGKFYGGIVGNKVSIASQTILTTFELDYNNRTTLMDTFTYDTLKTPSTPQPGISSGGYYNEELGTKYNSTVHINSTYTQWGRVYASGGCPIDSLSNRDHIHKIGTAKSTGTKGTSILVDIVSTNVEVEGVVKGQEIGDLIAVTEEVAIVKEPQYRGTGLSVTTRLSTSNFGHAGEGPVSSMAVFDGVSTKKAKAHGTLSASFSRTNANYVVVGIIDGVPFLMTGDTSSNIMTNWNIRFSKSAAIGAAVDSSSESSNSVTTYMDVVDNI